MDKNGCSKGSCCGVSNVYLIAVLFIVSGVLLICRNLGLIDSEVFNLVVSWQSLVTVIGLFMIFRGHITAGLIVGCVGAYFLLIAGGWMEQGQIRAYWPVIFILIGLNLLFKTRKRRFFKHAHHKFVSTDTTTDGFVYSENAFGGVERIVLDPVFKGANIKNSFGGMKLDLRRTALAQGDTFVDVDCNFGGIEIYMPSDWHVEIRVSSFFGSCEDKRFMPSSIPNSDSKLIIRGQNAFGGIEIKS